MIIISHQRIQVFNHEGEFLYKFGSIIEPKLKLQTNEISNIFIDYKDNFYIVEKNRIQKYNQNGKFISDLGEEVKSNGELFLITAFTVDNYGFIYIAYSDPFRVKIFNSEGEYLQLLDSFSACVVGIEVDCGGLIFVGYNVVGAYNNVKEGRFKVYRAQYY